MRQITEGLNLSTNLMPIPVILDKFSPVFIILSILYCRQEKLYNLWHFMYYFCIICSICISVHLYNIQKIFETSAFLWILKAINENKWKYNKIHVINAFQLCCKVLIKWIFSPFKFFLLPKHMDFSVKTTIST